MAGIGKSLGFFINRIPWTIGNNELAKYFSQFGYVSEARVIFNRNTGLSRRYGFVNVTDQKTYDAVMNEPTHKLDGKIVVVTPTKN